MPQGRQEIPPIQFPKLPGLKAGAPAVAAVVLLIVLLVPAYIWFVQRVEVPANHVLVLVRKMGEPLPAEADDQIILYPALLSKLGEGPNSTRFKGIQYEVKPEGRYFFDPLFWETRIVPATIIEQDEVGVLVRKYGKPLAGGKVVATEPDERGPLAEVRRQGRHNINPFAYDVLRVRPIRIPEGSVGVVTLYDGEAPANSNRYVVDKGERGVQPDVLPPGIFFMNPFAVQVNVIDVRSHTIDMRGSDEIRFPSNDSFDILVEGTVEYAIRQEKAPYLMAAIGDHDDIKDKLILPFMRSLARIEGSKLLAREFISGDTRRAFQDRVFEGLRRQCFEQGIEVRAALIRRIDPPAAIATPISDRQVAEQQIRQYQNEIELARSRSKLVEQEEMQKQNQEIGAANRDVVTVEVQAEQEKSVTLLQARQRLEVAKLNVEAARETAAATLSRGRAEADVTLMQFAAEAEPLRQAVGAFGDGPTYAQYFFYQKLGPSVRSVLASTEGPFADIFRSLSKPSSARPQPPAAAAPERANEITDAPASRPALP